MHAMLSQYPKRKVFVGMSGGIDSSVSAALLKEAGYDVTGVFIKVWQPEFMECQNTFDRADSMRAVAELGIKWRELNLEKEYKKFVVDYMIREYSRGRVPNPDVMCNRFVKFGKFYKWAIKNGADFISTGHYASVDNGFLSSSKDKRKDQTYFLWNVPKEVLPKLLFPVGGYLKSEVRKIAKDFGLSAADKKDSQGLCFVGRVDIKDFLGAFVKSKKGDVLNVSGEKIGWHDGAVFFTVGQRRGFNVSKKTPSDKPYYIVAKNIKRNTIIVSNRTPAENFSNPGFIKTVSVNWLCDPPASGLKCLARIRHGGEKVPVKVVKINNRSFTVKFKQKPVVPAGQSIVLYKDGICLGGGIIN